MYKSFKEYINVWLEGIIEEISFWENQVFSPDGENHDVFIERRVNNCEFRLEDDLAGIEGTGENGAISFMDVGSGPFSRCGYKSSNYNLQITYLDPLADAYNHLRDKYGLNNVIEVKTGFVELLDKQYSEGSFDVVHMSNSLDHSFDAVYGLYELLYVCRIGGKVILRHHENEADRSKYEGFHQWNLSVHNDENSFVIWRENERYDIRELFKEYADVCILPDLTEEESGWVYNKVIITKKKNIPLPENDYYEEIRKSVFRYLIFMFLKENDRRNRLGLQDPYSREIRNQLSNYRAKPEIFYNKMKEKGLLKINIYGAGKIGRELYSLCIESGIEVCALIDKNVNSVGLLPVILLGEYEADKNNSTIISTISNMEMLEDKNGKEIKMVTLDSLLSSL